VSLFCEGWTCCCI